MYIKSGGEYQGKVQPVRDRFAAGFSMAWRSTPSPRGSIIAALTSVSYDQYKNMTDTFAGRSIQDTKTIQSKRKRGE